MNKSADGPWISGFGHESFFIRPSSGVIVLNRKLFFLIFEIFWPYFDFQKKNFKCNFSKKIWENSFFSPEKILKIFSFFPKKDFLKRFLIFWAKKDFLKRFLFFWAKKDFLKRFLFFWAKKEFRKRFFFLFSEKRFSKKNLLPKSFFVRTRKELLKKDSFADPCFGAECTAFTYDKTKGLIFSFYLYNVQIMDLSLTGEQGLFSVYIEWVLWCWH